MKKEKTSLYIHIPFCVKKCSYCDFYSVEYEEELASDYVAVLAEQISKLRKDKYDFQTVYVGGGTPSVLGDDLLEQFMTCAELLSPNEFTVELNPESLTFAKLCLLRNCGVNRLSMGVQSFDDKVLKFLGRPHDKDKAIAAVKMASDAGFDNLSIDLIYAVPGMDLMLWKEQLKQAIKLPIKHLSLYSLSYEEGTPLYCSMIKDEFKKVDDSLDNEMYRLAQGFLEKHKFYQYEVSNFAKEGFESAHNTMYWANENYFGLGAGAVQYIDNKRVAQLKSVKSYIENFNTGVVEYDYQELLKAKDRALETAMLNMRSVKGIDFDLFLAKTGYDIQELKSEEIQGLLAQELVEYYDNKRGIRPTPKGFAFQNHIARELL